MKNTIKVMGVALALLLVFGLAGCPLEEEIKRSFVVEETIARLTITGIPSEYNGKWIHGTSDFVQYSGVPYPLTAANGFDTSDGWLQPKGVQIVNGAATLKVWVMANSGNTDYALNFDGIDPSINSRVSCQFTLWAMDAEVSSEGGNLPGLFGVTFTDGTATGAFVPPN